MSGGEHGSLKERHVSGPAGKGSVLREKQSLLALLWQREEKRGRQQDQKQARGQGPSCPGRGCT